MAYHTKPFQPFQPRITLLRIFVLLSSCKQSAPNLLRPRRSHLICQSFPLDCIKRAAYRMTAKASVDISTEAGNVVCVLHFTKPVTREQAAKAVEGLRLEVLDQDLRSVVAAETATVRNTILALAFSARVCNPLTKFSPLSEFQTTEGGGYQLAPYPLFAVGRRAIRDH